MLKRSPTYDPRTIARDIPGIFDSIFPQLSPGVVAHYNRTAVSIDCCDIVSDDLISQSSLQHSMLFELGFSAGEQLLTTSEIDWQLCTEKSITRQKRHFDAKIPSEITDIDIRIASMVASNLVQMLRVINEGSPHPIVVSPRIPGFEWIDSGNGDFSIGKNLIEVKCTSKNFSSSDYRQLVMYWLLSFASSIESGGLEWNEGVLLNPRSTVIVKVNFNELLNVLSAGRTKVEILTHFTALVFSRDIK